MIAPAARRGPWGDSLPAPYPFTSRGGRVQTTRQAPRVGRHPKEG
jgi:hypothetical protein